MAFVKTKRMRYINIVSDTNIVNFLYFYQNIYEWEISMLF